MSEVDARMEFRRVPIQFYINRKMRHQLKIIAKRRERSLSGLMRLLVKREIERGERDGLFTMDSE